MKRENKAEIVAEIINLFNDGKITAEKRDALIASVGLPKEKVSKPTPDPKLYGVQFKRGAQYFFKGLEYVDMPESERPKYCYFAVFHRGKEDDLPKLIIEFYTNQKLKGIHKIEDGKYVLKRFMNFGDMKKSDVYESLYTLALLQRNYNAVQAGEKISGKGADLIGDNPMDVETDKVETVETVEQVEQPEEKPAEKPSKKSSKK